VGVREDYLRDKATDDFYYDMLAQVKMDKWSKGRVVLLGDAGQVHCKQFLLHDIPFYPPWILTNFVQVLRLSYFGPRHDSGPYWGL
jgi:hypothetical protein